VIQLKEEEIAALRACLEVACPSEDDELPTQQWNIADKALKMIESKYGDSIVRLSTDDTSPKYLVQVDLFNVYSSGKISPEGLKTSIQTMVCAAILNEIKIVHQRDIGRPLAQEDAIGMLRNIRNSVHVTRVR
jgi:hypothetical protein